MNSYEFVVFVHNHRRGSGKVKDHETTSLSVGLGYTQKHIYIYISSPEDTHHSCSSAGQRVGKCEVYLPEKTETNTRVFDALSSLLSLLCLTRCTSFMKLYRQGRHVDDSFATSHATAGNPFQDFWQKNTS